MTMAPEILVAMTPLAQERAPAPLIFYDVVYETGFDPWEPWYPCGCPHRLDDIHVDDCWLDWLAFPLWMREDTTEVPVLVAAGGWVPPEESDVDDDTALLGVVEPLDPEYDGDDDEGIDDDDYDEEDEEELSDGDVRGAADESTVDDGDGRGRE